MLLTRGELCGRIVNSSAEKVLETSFLDQKAVFTKPSQNFREIVKEQILCQKPSKKPLKKPENKGILSKNRQKKTS